MTTVLAVGEAPNRADAHLTGDGVVLSNPAYEKKLPGLMNLTRVNLLSAWPGPQGKGSAFPLNEAREAARLLWSKHPLTTQFLILSLRAAEAFWLSRTSGYPLAEWFAHNGRIVAVIPHPSGIVLWWNDPDNREKAVKFMESLPRKDRP